MYKKISVIINGVEDFVGLSASGWWVFLLRG